MSRPLRVGSVCSGAGFMDLGFHRAGLRTAWFCEADPFRRKLLARHFPGVPCYPDLTTLDPAELEPVDVLAGGTPCQDFSVAGNRAGLEGSRSSLYWHFIRVREALRPEWTIWENVLGAFSTNGGGDFAAVLGALVGADVPVPAERWRGAGVASGPLGVAAWRVLNAQWFGVPQRRRRVFVAAHLGGTLAPEVLLECEGGCGHPPTSGEAGTDAAVSFGAGVAGSLGGGSRRGGSDPTDLERGGGRIRPNPVVANALDTARGGADDNDARGGHLVIGR